MVAVETMLTHTAIAGSKMVLSAMEIAAPVARPQKISNVASWALSAIHQTAPSSCKHHQFWCQPRRGEAEGHSIGTANPTTRNRLSVGEDFSSSHTKVTRYKKSGYQAAEFAELCHIFEATPGPVIGVRGSP